MRKFVFLALILFLAALALGGSTVALTGGSQLTSGQSGSVNEYENETVGTYSVSTSYVAPYGNVTQLHYTPFLGSSHSYLWIPVEGRYYMGWAYHFIEGQPYVDEWWGPSIEFTPGPPWTYQCYDEDGNPTTSGELTVN